MNLVQPTMEQQNVAYVSWWVGLSDVEHPGRCTWYSTDKAPDPAIVRWSSGWEPPVTANGGDGSNCAALLITRFSATARSDSEEEEKRLANNWHAVPCGRKPSRRRQIGYICEMPIAAADENDTKNRKVQKLSGDDRKTSLLATQIQISPTPVSNKENLPYKSKGTSELPAADVTPNQRTYSPSTSDSAKLQEQPKQSDPSAATGLHERLAIMPLPSFDTRHRLQHPTFDTPPAPVMRLVAVITPSQDAITGGRNNLACSTQQQPVTITSTIYSSALPLLEGRLQPTTSTTCCTQTVLSLREIHHYTSTITVTASAVTTSPQLTVRAPADGPNEFSILKQRLMTPPPVPAYSRQPAPAYRPYEEEVDNDVSKLTEFTTKTVTATSLRMVATTVTKTQYTTLTSFYTTAFTRFGAGDRWVDMAASSNRPVETYQMMSNTSD